MYIIHPDHSEPINHGVIRATPHVVVTAYARAPVIVLSGHVVPCKLIKMLYI